MPLPTFATLDEVPEAVRDGYIEKNGKWVPDNSADRTILAEKKAADAELARLRAALGDTKPEDIAALRKAQKDAEEAEQRKAGDFDKLLEKRLNETKAEYEKRINELAPYKTKYEDRELDIAIRDAAAKAGVISEDMKHVLQITKGSRVKLDEKTGKPVVVDADGDVTGQSVEKFFAETFKAEAPKFYEAAGGSGGGATGGTAAAKAGAGTVKITDTAGLLANLDGVAKGTVKVTQ